MKNSYATTHPTTHLGFTIVELLIVIVVIGILAAISVVAYTGLTNGANDAAVKSDMSNVAKFMELYRAEYGAYPTYGQLTSSANRPRLTRSAYTGGGTNAIICVVPDGSSAAFAFVATSKSGARLSVSSTKSSGTYTGSWGGGAVICEGAGVTWDAPGRWANWLTDSSTATGFNGIFPG